MVATKFPSNNRNQLRLSGTIVVTCYTDECKKMRPLVEEGIAALQTQEDEMQAVSDKFQEALQVYRK